MTHIAEATTAQAPPSRADMLDFIARLPKGHEGQRVLRLKAGPRGAALMEHDVEVEFDPPTGEHGGEFEMRVAWQPVGTMLLPRFSGILRFERDKNYPYTWIFIEGDYEPPLGKAGKAFDAIAGERIARSTMRALLDDLRAALENAVRARELGGSKP
jgi:hypothetical protein